MNVDEHNRRVWDEAARNRGEWSTPVDDDEIAAALRGDWHINLTPQLAVPDSWIPPLVGADVLGLASGGGRQGPILAAAGANVTVLDASEGQLALDRDVAERHGLPLATAQGDMRDLSRFADASFDVIVHPIANCYVAEVRPIWREAFRVLRPGGLLLAGWQNPALYLFDAAAHERGVLTVRHRLPFADDTDLPASERERRIAQGVALEFGHTLEDQIAGQLDAGFVLTDLYEDRQPNLALAAHMATAVATRAAR
jgi:SAM-dependent methyltransferase